jgi:toxin YoeB
MNITWSHSAWDDYLYWQTNDKRKLKQINKLIKDILRSPFEGIGNPEPLKYELSSFWSRRITQEHRLVYQVEEGQILIAQCRHHY